MNSALPAAICIVFVGLGLWHFYWALGGGAVKNVAIPEVEGKLAFNPSAAVTAVVGLVLILCAALVAAASGLIHMPLPGRLLSWLCYALALVLLARAIGDFRLVGLFKRIRGSRFARLDTAVYSPLCLALSTGVFFVGFSNAA